MYSSSRESTIISTKDGILECNGNMAKVNRQSDRPRFYKQSLASISTNTKYYTRNNAKYACKFCLKLRPAHTFADNQLYGARGKRGSECDRRVCLDCGFRQRIYQPGQPVVVNGREQILCCLCGERRRYGLYCMLCWRCESCFSKHSMPKIPFHTSLEQYIRQHGCPRCSHHLEDLGSPELESHVTIEELLFQRMKIAGSEKDLEEAACSWYEDYR